MNSLPSEFLTDLREAAGSAVWSQAVENSRRDLVTVDAQPAGEIHTRVFDPALKRGFSAKLYVADGDWECNCGGRQDPCVHVVTAAITVRRAIEKGEALPVSKRNVGRLLYRFWRRDDGLKFERIISNGSEEEVLKVPLTSHMATATSELMAAPADQDFRVDVALAQERRGVLKPTTMHDLLRALAGHTDVELDGKPVAVQAEALGLMVELRDEGAGVRVIGRMDDRLQEVFRNGVGLCADGLHPTRVPELSPELARLIREGGWFGPQQLPRFESEILPQLAEKVRLVNRSQRLRMAERTPPHIELERLARGGEVGLVARIVYGDPVGLKLIHGQPMSLDPERQFARDPDSERRLADEYRRRADRGIDEILWLPAADAQALVVKWQARMPPKWLSRAEIRELAQPTRLGVDFQMTDGVPMLRLLAEHGEDISLGAAWRAHQEGSRLFTTPAGRVVELPSEWLERSAALVEAILLSAGQGAKATPAMRLVQQAAAESVGLSPVASAFPGSTLEPEAWSLPPAQCAADFSGQLRSYQSHGAAWVQWLNQQGCGGILADDMGLGKTIQVLAGLPAGSLIVAPASLVGNWLAEFRKFRPASKIQVYHGDRRELVGAESSITITTYGVVRSDVDRLAQVKWQMVIADEAQAMRNPESQTAQAMLRLPARQRLALTGTPMENSLLDLWSVMQFANPGLLGERTSFMQRYGRGGLSAAEALRLRAVIKPFLLRRLKSKVATELPPKSVIPLVVDLSEVERQAYQALHARIQSMLQSPDTRARGMMAFLPLLLQMRFMCCHLGLLDSFGEARSSKVEVLIDKLSELVSAGNRVLIFSQWTKMLDLLEPELRERDWGFCRLDGSTKDRMAIVQKFQAADGPPIMLVSLKAGGVGLNLTAADHIFILDPWWNPAAEDQAADRAYRIGQDKPVFVYKMIARDTIEERVIALQDQKRELYELAIEGRGVASASLADIEFLIQ